MCWDVPGPLHKQDCNMLQMSFARRAQFLLLVEPTWSELHDQLINASKGQTEPRPVARSGTSNDIRKFKLATMLG